MKKTAVDIRLRLLMGMLSAYVWQTPLTTRAEDLGKIMPMGDSITYGVPVAGGYRDPLYTLLNTRGDTFTFVGSSTDNSTPTLTAAGQTHHEGWSGYLIGPGSTEDRQGMTLDQNLETWIGSGAESPDKILLMIGTNDINLGYDMPNAPARLSNLIDHIYGYRPSVKLYVASIVPMSGHEADVLAFNTAIPTIVASHRALGRDVVYVPMYEALNSSTDFNPEDLLHPNALGYQHMAQAWDTALHATISLTAEITGPANGQSFTVGASIAATATVANATGSYDVHVYTNSGSGTFAEAGTGSSSPYSINLGVLPAGTYHIYATVTDMLTTSTTSTNLFTVYVGQGQQTLDLTGWTQDIVIGAAETAPGYSETFAGWNFYETGLPGGTQGLAADSGANPRTFTSSHNPSVKFQFAPYAGNNAVYLNGPGNATLTLVNPAKFQSLQFLETTRSMSWYARLNFSDGSSRTTGTWYDPDWTENPGPADWCLTSYGLRLASDGGFYSGYLWMAEREFTLPVADQAKTLTSITICTTGTGDRQLAVFAVSGYALDSLVGVRHAVDVTGIGDGPGFGDTFSVGWEFTVSQSIKITALGQFDPDSNPKANTVAIYRRAGAKLVEAVVSDSSPSELSGNYPARYAVIGDLILTPGEYVVLSTQNGDNFIAPGGSTAATFGPGITWTKCFALDWGSAAGPLPATALENWPIQSANAWRYFGPTFKYELVVPPPTLVLVSPTNNQALAASASVYAVATVADAIGAYTVHVYTNGGSGAFAEVGAGGSSSPCYADLGALPNGTYHIYASVADTLASSVTATNTFTVSVKTAQQTLGLTGWNYDIILGKTETAPGYNNSMADWLFYEAGLSGGPQGLAADAGDTPRTVTSARNPSIKFQLRPYTANNAVYLQGTASATLTLVNPAKFLSLQFLETTRTMSWYAKLNFADGSSTDTSTWSDPDWTSYPGPDDWCLTSYGLRGTGGNFYANYLWMAGREFTLPIADQAKTLTSITVYTLGNNGQQLALFAVSGYALAPSLDVAHAVDVNTINEGPVGGDIYSVGWDFTVSQTITVTALGQFDFDSNPQANTVAIYQRAGAKLAEVVVANDAPAEASGNYPARYAKIRKLILPPGDYVIFSTQNGDNFIASYSSDFGPAVRWNKGVALASGSAAGPLPAAAPTNWPIEDGSNPWRFFGPTFRYKMGAVWPEGTLLRLK